MTETPEWLRNAKQKLLLSSKNVAILRAQIAREIHIKLKQAGKLKSHGFANMNKADRDSIFRSVTDTIISALTSHTSNVSEDNANFSSGMSLLLSIREEAEKTLDEQLGVSIMAKIEENIYTTGLDTLEAKMKLVMRESEQGVMSLLSQWPDLRVALRGCINVSLSKDLRKIAWLTALSDSDTTKDFFSYINTDRVEKNSAIFGSTLFHICQSCLGNHQHLLKLTSQYRVVKRMEQVLGYLIHDKSIPHLRSLNLAIESLEPDESTQQSSQKRSHSELAQFQIFKEGNLRQRQMLFMVPFLKAMELDDADIMSFGASHEERMQKTKYFNTDQEFVAKAAEPNTKDWLNIFHANEITAKKKTGGFSLDLDEARTARIAEVYARFWSIIPFSWREEGRSMVQSISADLETYLQTEDPDLFHFLTRILGESEKFAQHLIGDAFIGKCRLSVQCFIFDQLILASFESTGDENFPSMDSLCAWICGSMLIFMRDKIIKCISAQELYTISTVNQYAITVNILSATLEVHFLRNFRNSVPDLSQTVNFLGNIFSNSDKDFNLQEKIASYLESTRRKVLNLNENYDKSVPISEEDIIFAETEELVLLKEFYIAKQKKDKRLKLLMRKWKSFSKSLGFWSTYIKLVTYRNQQKAERARGEAERIRKLVDEEFNRRQTEQERFLRDKQEDKHIFGVWGDNDSNGDEGEDADLQSKAFGLNNDPLLYEEMKRQEMLRKDEEEAAEMERKRFAARNLKSNKPRTIGKSLVVKPGVFEAQLLKELEIVLKTPASEASSFFETLNNIDEAKRKKILNEVEENRKKRLLFRVKTKNANEAELMAAEEHATLTADIVM
ncbi:hypothetical protein HK100_003547 [Physocladia obscura]|uniref:Uncharacterized protein n=1 Tax=Physocladia obscura TaxID=109957 RepID=A0AAD5TAP4_9FUNG|nr:hypothetical protein HK100_003547 [Physocladia obscura]